MKLCRIYTAAELKMLKTGRKVAGAQHEGLQLGHRFDSTVTKSRAFEGVPGLLRVAAGRRVKRLQQFCGQELRNPPDTNSILSIRMSRNRKKTHARRKEASRISSRNLCGSASRL